MALRIAPADPAYSKIGMFNRQGHFVSRSSTTYTKENWEGDGGVKVTNDLQRKAVSLCSHWITFSPFFFFFSFYLLLLKDLDTVAFVTRLSLSLKCRLFVVVVTVSRFSPVERGRFLTAETSAEGPYCRFRRRQPKAGQAAIKWPPPTPHSSSSSSSVSLPREESVSRHLVYTVHIMMLSPKRRSLYARSETRCARRSPRPVFSVAGRCSVIRALARAAHARPFERETKPRPPGRPGGCGVKTPPTATTIRF